ncbi:MAG: histidinol-phosphatase HisJ family protein [Bacillota bacterium]
MRADYHMHSRHSSDGSESVRAMFERAAELGLDEIAVTDHFDFDEAFLLYPNPVVAELAREIRSVQGRVPRVRFGAEVALKDAKAFEDALEYIGDQPIDLIIGSVHNTGGNDPYDAAFFEGRPREEAYADYLEHLAGRCVSATGYSTLGHFDYVAKKAPYAQRTVRYLDNPDAFDRVFRHLAHNGIGIEINTSVYRTSDEPMWGLDILQRFVELGGEFVTFGSDAHSAGRIGFRLEDARELARAAGVRYQASFERMRPFLFPL